MRQIEPQMINYIDDRLKDDPVAGVIIKNKQKKNARVLMILAARACVGIREVGGNNDGPMVRLLQETIGTAGKEAWCMSFVQTIIAYVEVKLGLTSPLLATEHCMTLWNKTPWEQKVLKIPAPGAIPIWNYLGTTNGHTGIMSTYDIQQRTFEAIEGNTESGLVNGTVERDGGGVYLTRRNVLGQGKMKLVGFIIPFKKEV